MIRLGSIPVTQSRAVIEARDKIMRVVHHLSRHPVAATRLATATSQIARHMLNANGGRIDVDLVASEHQCELLLTFAASHWYPPLDLVTRFFPQHSPLVTRGDEHSVRAITRFAHTGRPHPSVIDALSSIVQQKSRDELMSEVQSKNIELEHHRAHLEETVRQRTAQLASEKENSDRLLHMIIPKEIAGELLATGRVRPRRHDQVAVLFADLAGFTPYCRGREPEEIVDNLHRLFTAFEEYALEYQLEKIKTIGDSFMAACGLVSEVENPVENCVRCALKMITTARSIADGWELRAGIHVGPIVAGVLGTRKQQYDLWGDTVNVASRMESHGVAGSIALSEAAWAQIRHLGKAELSERIHVKGLGEQPVYLFRRFHSPAD